MNCFDVPTTQMPIFILFKSVGVLFEGAISLGISLVKVFRNAFRNTLEEITLIANIMH